MDTNIENQKKVSFSLDLIEKFTKQIIVADTASNFRTVLTQIVCCICVKTRLQVERVKREQSSFLRNLSSLLPSSPHCGEHVCPVTWESYDAWFLMLTFDL